MQLCAACGTENRDKARFCRRCAEDLWSPTLAEPVPQRRTSRRRALAEPGTGATGAPARKAALALLLIAAATGIGWWLAQRGAPPEAAQAAPAQSTPALPASPSAAAAPVTEAPAVPAGSAADASPSAVAAAERLRLSLEKLAQEDRARSAEQARARAALPVPAPPRAAPHSAPRPVAVPAPETPATELPSAPAAASPARAPVAPPPATVEAVCASRGNLFSRGLCRIQTCGQAAFASDPTCVEFRRMEDKHRRDQEG